MGLGPLIESGVFIKVDRPDLHGLHAGSHKKQSKMHKGFSEDNAGMYFNCTYTLLTPLLLCCLHEPGIMVVQGPPSSPDLYPIEELWPQFKKAIHARGPIPVAKLHSVLEKEWNALASKAAVLMRAYAAQLTAK